METPAETKRTPASSNKAVIIIAAAVIIAVAIVAAAFIVLSGGKDGSDDGIIGYATEAKVRIPFRLQWTKRWRMREMATSA